MKRTLAEICGTEWKILEVKQLTLKKKFGDYEELPEDEELDGFTDYNNQIIYLNSELHPHRKAVTLVHEWMHVIVDYVGAEWPGAGEKEIRKLEHHVYDLLMKFPEEYKK